MIYLNPLLGLLVIAVLAVVAILLIDPKAARYVAHILLARAAAVEEARIIYRRIRRSDILIAREETE